MKSVKHNQEFDKWLDSEERRHSNSRNIGRGEGLSYENFQSSKYDFQNIPSSEPKHIYIPELGMTVGTISGLKHSWRKYRWSKQDNEPTRDLCMRILTLQKGLGLEQSEWLIEEARQQGYTDTELMLTNPTVGEEDEWTQDLTSEELEAQKEEQLENNLITPATETETEDEDWTVVWSDDD